MTTPEFEISRNILSGNTADYEIIRTGEILREEKIKYNPIEKKSPIPIK